jgi:hypothetical protein
MLRRAALASVALSGLLLAAPIAPAKAAAGARGKLAPSVPGRSAAFVEAGRPTERLGLIVQTRSAPDDAVLAAVGVAWGDASARPSSLVRGDFETWGTSASWREPGTRAEPDTAALAAGAGEGALSIRGLR